MCDLTITEHPEARWLSGFGSVALKSLVLASSPDWWHDGCCRLLPSSPKLRILSQLLAKRMTSSWDGGGISSPCGPWLPGGGHAQELLWLSIREEECGNDCWLGNNDHYEVDFLFHIECLLKLLQAFLRISSTCQKGNILFRHLQIAKYTTSGQIFNQVFFNGKRQPYFLKV